MTKKELLSLSPMELNQKVLIEGTKFDRKRKVNEKMVARMRRMRDKGMTYRDIGDVFGVTGKTVRYNLDEDYRQRTIDGCSGSHTGKVNITVNDRIKYKRALVQAGAKVILV